MRGFPFQSVVRGPGISGLFFSGVLAFGLAGAAGAEIWVVSSGGATPADRVVRISDRGVVVGDLIRDDAGLATPIEAVPSGRGTVFLSDQLNDSVYEYSMAGVRIGTVAGPAQGLDNVRGIAVQGNSLYVTVASGTYAGSVQAFDLTTGVQTTAFAAGGLTSPWDVAFLNGEALVSDSGSDNVYAFDPSGTFKGVRISAAATGLNFPQQIAQGSGTDLIVGGFSLPTKIVRTDATGGTFTSYPMNTGVRGVHRYGNGSILWSGGTRLGLLDPATGTSQDLFNDPNYSFRFITAVPEPASLAGLGLGLATLRRRRRDGRRGGRRG